jgi:hypothetical protein
MKNKTLLLACGLLLVLRSADFAQTTSECDKLLKHDITKDSPKLVLKNFTTSKCFGLDSIDLKIFGSGPVLGGLLAKLAQTKDKITNGDLLAEINKQKAYKEYPKIRAEIITMNALELMEATPYTWQKGKTLLIAINTPGDEIENLHAFMLKNRNQHWNYKELVATYERMLKTNSKP